MCMNKNRYLMEKHRTRDKTSSLSTSFDCPCWFLELIPELKALVLGFLGPYEHTQLARTNFNLNTICASLLAPFKEGCSLSLYNVFSCFQKSTGYQRDSCQRLLRTCPVIQPLENCLLNNGPVEVIIPFKFSTMFQYFGLGYHHNPLYSWLLVSGKSLTTDMIKVAVENVHFAELDYSIIFKIIERIELGHVKSKQLLVSLIEKYPDQINKFAVCACAIFVFPFQLSPSTIFMLLDIFAITIGKIRFKDTNFFVRCIDEGYFDIVSMMINHFEGCEGLEELEYRMDFRTEIMLHSPQTWCKTEDRLLFALTCILERDKIGEFLLKLNDRIIIVELSDKLSSTIQEWINEPNSECLFKLFLSKTTGFEASYTLCYWIVKAHCDPNFSKWNPALVVSFLIETKSRQYTCPAITAVDSVKGRIKFKLINEQFLAIAKGAEQHILMCLANFTVKQPWLIWQMILADISPLMLRHFVLIYRQEFLNALDINEKSSEELVNFGIAHGYDLETMEFIIERIYPQKPKASCIVPSSHEIKQLYTIASSHFKGLETAESMLTREAFRELLLYDPARWCTEVEAVSFAVLKLYKTGRLLEFLDCLPRQLQTKISQKTFMLACKSNDSPDKIFLKLLEKFPSTQIFWYSDEKYPEIHKHFSPEGILILSQHGAFISSTWNGMPLEILIGFRWAEKPSSVFRHLIERHAPIEMIKYFGTITKVLLEPDDFVFCWPSRPIGI